MPIPNFPGGPEPPNLGGLVGDEDNEKTHKDHKDGDGDGTTTYTGGSTSSSGAAPSQAALIAWQTLLSQLGIRLSDNMRNLIQHAISGGWSQTEFMWNLRKTPEYEATFPGIMNPNGTMKMTEAQYMALEKSFQETADLYGIHLNRENQALLFEGDVSAREWQQRAMAINRIRENPEAFAQFEAAARAQGLIKGKFNRKDAYHLAIGEGPTEWYKLLEEFGARTAAAQAGFDITKHSKLAGYLDLSRKQVLAINKAVPGLGGEAQMAAAMQKLAQDFRQYIGAGHITGFDVTPEDLIQLEFGGPRQAQVADTVARILAAVKARQEPLAQPTFASTAQGPQLYGVGTQSRPTT